MEKTIMKRFNIGDMVEAQCINPAVGRVKGVICSFCGEGIVVLTTMDAKEHVCALDGAEKLRGLVE